MQGMGEIVGEVCLFEFNFDLVIFKVGDMVSYCVIGSLEGFFFVGMLLEVYVDYVVIVGDLQDLEVCYCGMCESWLLVEYSEIQNFVVMFVSLVSCLG